MSMNEPTPPPAEPDVPVPPLKDAWNRGWRTLLWGLASDVVVVCVLFLLPVFTSGEFDWTTTDWKLLAFSLAKTVTVAVLSYLARVLGLSRSTITR